MAREHFQFHPVVSEWLERKFGSPTEPQERGWPAIQSGAHTLIAAPTGSGKTLAAFLASLDSLFREGLQGALKDETRVLYVSPLKALSNDIHKNLEEPLAEIQAAFKAGEGHDITVRGSPHGRHSRGEAPGHHPASAAHFGHDARIPIPAADFRFRAKNAWHGAHADCG